MKKILLVVTLLSSFLSSAQELNCQVSIITNAKLDVTTVEQEIFKELEQAIFDFMNGTKWTDDQFEVEERINCNLQFQVNNIEDGNFSGALQIQSSRPAYNSSYNTVMFNFQDDDIAFNYSRGSSNNLRHTPNQFNNNLSSVLAFYAYYILGMDYDSFSPQGGTKYFTEAQQIVTIAQTSAAKGWRSNERGKRNRYWLIDNALHELFSPLRQCNYEYHRKGIDKLYDERTEARKAMTAALKRLMKVVATRPNSLNLLNFLQSKSIELKNLYQDAEQKEKNEIVNLLKRLDPANSSKYQEILG